MTPWQIPSQIVGERVGFHRWLGFLMLGWGAIATSMIGLGPKPYHLYIIRFLLGACLLLACKEDPPFFCMH